MQASLYPGVGWGSLEFIVGGERFGLARSGTHLEGYARVSAGEACELFRRWAHEGRPRSLIAVAHLAGVDPPTARRGVEKLLRRVIDELQHPVGGIALWRHGRVHPTVDPRFETPVDLKLLTDRPDELDKEHEDHWIEIRLVDEAAQPITGERYELELPDGKKKTGHTDGAGVVFIDPIFKPGSCRVLFPDLADEMQESA